MPTTPLARRSLLTAALAVPALAACANDTGRAPGGSARSVATSVTSSTTTATPTTTTPTISTAQLLARTKAYLAGRTAMIGYTVHDLRTGVKLDVPYTNQTASTIKVLVLSTVLRVSQETGTPLTANQKSLATMMIEHSDNNATTALFKGVGGRPTLQRVAGLLGLTHTQVHDAWGISTTTPTDWGHLMDQIVQGTDVLTDDSRAYIRSLMGNVAPEQRWGVANPPISGATVALTKNGWLPYQDVWHVNSMGYIEGQGRKYTLAMLSRSPNGFAYGVQTLNGLSTTIFNALADPLSA